MLSIGTCGILVGACLISKVVLLNSYGKSVPNSQMYWFFLIGIQIPQNNWNSDKSNIVSTIKCKHTCFTSWYSIIKMKTITAVSLICKYWWHVVIVNQYSLKNEILFYRVVSRRNVIK